MAAKQDAAALGMNGKSEKRQESVVREVTNAADYYLCTVPSACGEWAGGLLSPPRLTLAKGGTHRGLTMTFRRNRSITNTVRQSSFIAVYHPKRIIHVLYRRSGVSSSHFKPGAA
jgi:hypothetical protein